MPSRLSRSNQDVEIIGWGGRILTQPGASANCLKWLHIKPLRLSGGPMTNTTLAPKSTTIPMAMEQRHPQEL
jgi:hypothetical protein